MPIHDLQRQAHEVGRIRLGDKGSKGQPRKLDCFRLTSQNRSILECASKRYGGEVRSWEGRPGYFEVYLTVKELPFMASPVELSQWYELWKAGGCERRCDGSREWRSDTPCMCDPEARECKITTRFSVYLYELPGLGIFRLETHGFYAATELPAEAQWLIESARRGRPIRATLSIEQRQVKKAGEVTKNFIVPVIHTPLSIDQIMSEQPIVKYVTEGTPEHKAVSEQKAIEAPKKETFRQHLISRVKHAFDYATVSPTVVNMSEACYVSEDVTAKFFNDKGAFVWTRLSSEQLLQAMVFADTGKPMADLQAIKDTLEVMKHDFENPPLADAEQDISEEEL